ncbi:MAG: hypothetical protein ACK4QW_15225 [Alphaproteobacteria bacterium]
MNIVPYYGIHWDRKIAYLMQGRSGTNAIGSKEKVPFQVQLPGKRRHCNHQIPLATPVPNDYHWDYFIQLLDDPLVRAMLPIPKADPGAFFLVDDDAKLNTILVLLSKLSSPIHNVVTPMWTTTPSGIVDQMQTTNVQPLVYSGVEPKHSDTVNQVAKATPQLPSKVIFVGSGDTIVPAGMRRLTTSLGEGQFDVNDLIALPWENLGATVVRKYMRNEWPPSESDHAPGRPKASSSRRPL